MTENKAKAVMVTVTGSITLDEHRSFRSQSSLAGLSAKDAVAMAIREWLAARGIMPEGKFYVPACSGGGGYNIPGRHHTTVTTSADGTDIEFIGGGGRGDYVPGTELGTGGNGGNDDE